MFEAVDLRDHEIALVSVSRRCLLAPPLRAQQNPAAANTGASQDEQQTGIPSGLA